MSIRWNFKVLGVRKTLILLAGRRIKRLVPKESRIDLSPKACISPFYVRMNSSDTDILQSIFLGYGYGKKGEYAEIFEKSSKYMDILRNAEVVVDLGANIGAFDVWLGMVKKNIKKLIAVEPEESNFASLKMNNSNDERTILYQAGIWNKCCGLKIVPRDTGEWGFTVHEAAGDETPDVEAVDMWKIIEDNQLERINILKMDIEGSEYEVFAENYDWIPMIDMLIVETHERFKPGSQSMVIDRMTENGFIYEQVGEDLIFTRGDNEYGTEQRK